MDDLSAGEFGGIFAGIITLLGLAGAGIKWVVEWLTGQRGTRMSKLERRVDRLNAKVVMIGGALARAVEELRHHAPDASGLAHYERVLRIAFPVERGVPDDLAQLVAQLEEED